MKLKGNLGFCLGLPLIAGLYWGVTAGVVRETYHRKEEKQAVVESREMVQGRIEKLTGVNDAVVYHSLIGFGAGMGLAYLLGFIGPPPKNFRRYS